MKLKYYLVLILLLVIEHASACTCSPVPFEQEYTQAAGIVVGKVVGITVKSYNHNLKNGRYYNILVRQYRIRVKKTYKGEKVKTLKITTPHEGATCGLRLKKGSTYLIYALTDERYGLYSTLCNRHYCRKQARFKDEIAALEGVNEKKE